ncbi:MAG: DUF3786 domain-containing protein [Oscillospiraceae bacterium]|nr:DUF3786 domain-containing protein [Oscillospiraceae bacterium]
MEDKKKNWDISFEMHVEKYSEIDPVEAAKRTNIEFDSELSRFILNILGFKLYAEWPVFKLIPANDNNKTCPKALYDFEMQVLAMRVLYLGSHAPPTGIFKAYRELPWGTVYDDNFNGRCIKRFAFGFGFKPEVFAKSAEQLDGKKVDFGDVAYDFPFLGDVTVRLILWKPDDEFPPSAQILFSDNCVIMYNAEDLAAVGDVIISALKEIS